MNKILVLGHRGKVGSQIVQFFSDSKTVEVITYEGYIEQESLQEFLLKHKDIACVVNTISKFRGENSEIFKSNTEVVNSLIQALIAADIKPKIIHFSSAGVYSSTKEAKNETSSVDPSTYYLLCKALADRLLEYYRNYFDIIILRPGGIFGDTITDGFMYNMEQAAQNTGKITLIGSSEKTRSILNIQYLLSFIDKIIKEDIHIGVVNLSTQTITLQNFVDHLIKKYPGLQVIREEDKSDNDKLSHMNIDNTLAKSILEIQKEFVLTI